MNTEQTERAWNAARDEMRARVGMQRAAYVRMMRLRPDGFTLNATARPEADEFWAAWNEWRATMAECNAAETAEAIAWAQMPEANRGIIG